MNNPLRNLYSILVRVSPLQMLILIAAMATATTWFVGQEIDRRVASQPKPVPVAPSKCQVLYCAKNISEGDVITNDVLEMRQVEANRAPIDAISDPTEAIGHPAKYSLLAGAPLVAHDLAAPAG